MTLLELLADWQDKSAKHAAAFKAYEDAGGGEELGRVVDWAHNAMSDAKQAFVEALLKRRNGEVTHG